MHEEIIRLDSLTNCLYFSKKVFPRESIVELASDLRSPLNQALIVKAIAVEIVTLDELRKKNSGLSEVMLNAWKTDFEVKKYLKGKGLAVQKPLSSEQQLRKDNHRKMAASVVKTTAVSHYVTAPAELICGEWELDMHSKRLWRGEKTERLKRNDARVLMVLMQKYNQTVTYVDICKHADIGITEPNAHLYLKSVMSILHKALTRLNAPAGVIEHLAGIGYRFSA